MLIRFTVSNFLSFDKEAEFNMIAGSFKTHKHHVYDTGKINVLKAAAIYGPNGAGKSNLIKAIEFMQALVIEGKTNKSINEEKFKLNPANEQLPSTFEIEFSTRNKIYVYGISVDKNIIVEEWLYESLVTSDAKLIFERMYGKDKKNKILIAQKYRKTKKAQLLIELMEENLLKTNELFLGKTDSLKIDELSNVRNWLKEELIIIHPKSKFQNLLPAITSSDAFKSFANELLETFDTGVSELGVGTLDIDHFFGEDEEDLKKEIILELEQKESSIVILNTNMGDVLIAKEDNKYVVKSLAALHKDNNGNNVPFSIESESDGTQRLLDFIPAFHQILRYETTFIIDEIDQSLHPTLLQALVKKIMLDDQTKGQFIFSTHESNLLDLDIFRQDEIWFVEKEKTTGSTQLYSLSEFKPRHDLNIKKGYLKGRFGAIPFMADLNNLNWNQHGV